jgi:hypothetical protein
MAILLLAGSVRSLAAGTYVYPLKRSANGRYLVDQNGRPFRIQGDSAQSMIANLTYAEANAYLTDRQARGFNAVNVDLLAHRFAIYAPANRNLDPPFTTPGDFSTPNEAYFAFADSIIDLAASKGMLVSFVPMYLGYGGGGEGWWEELNESANTQSVCFNYGKYVGNRYRNRKNILWVIGGDYSPPAGSEGEKRLHKVLEGVKAAGATQLWAGDWNAPTLSTDQVAFAAAMNTNAVYTYGIGGMTGTTYHEARRGFARAPTIPAYLKETGYEAEGWIPGTPADIRKYQYWAVLSGCTAGLFYGHRDVWEFATDTWWSGFGFGHQRWQDSLDSTGAHDMQRMGLFLDALPWYDLVPSGLSGMKTLVTDGGGFYGNLDYVTAAATADGRVLVAYVPPTGTGSRDITVDMSALARPATARWFNPASGAYLPIASALPNAGTRVFTTPGDNGTGQNDWVLVLDNNLMALVQFGATGYSVSEAASSATITVKRSGPLSETVTVHYEASDGSARAGSDYGATTGDLVFGPGVVLRTFAVPIVRDTLVEGNQTVILSLSDPTGNAALGLPNTAVLTIVDNDVAGKVQFSSPAYVVNEAGPFATITVWRTAGTASGVTARYETSGGTAVQGLDYTAASGILTFAAGQTTQTFSIPIHHDGSAVNPNATVGLLLSEPGGGGTLGAYSTAVLNILENNPVVQFAAANYSVPEYFPRAAITVKRFGPPAGTVTVEYKTSDGTAVAGTSYTAAAGTLTFGPGIMARTFYVSIKNDTTHDASETVILSLSNPSTNAALGYLQTAVLSIGDNDPAGAIAFTTAGYGVGETAGSATVTVKRTGGSASGVTVRYQTSDGTAQAGVNYVAANGTLSFGPGVVVRSFPITILDTGVPAGDQTVKLTLTDPTGGATLGPLANALLTIRSDDPLLQFSAASYAVGESGPSAFITVRRSGPMAGTVTVDYETSDGTAYAPTDYTSVAGTLTFAPNVIVQTFKVPVSNSALVETNETVNLTLSNPGGGAALGARDNAVLTIRTDDPRVAFRAAKYVVAEAARGATITVGRSLPVTKTVTVDYATSDGTAKDGQNYTGVSGTLTFLPGIVTRTFVVPIVNDSADEVSETVNLALSQPTNANLGTPSEAVLSIADNDVAGKVQFSAAAYSVSEKGGTATVTVTRTMGAAGDVTVPYETANGTASAGTNYTGTSGVLTFDQGEAAKTFTVDVFDDGVVTGNKTVLLKLGAPGGGAALGIRASAVLWIVDGGPPP